MLPSVLVMSMQTNMQQDNANYLHSQNNTAYIEQLGDKVRTSYIMGVILQSFKCHIQHIFNDVSTTGQTTMAQTKLDDVKYYNRKAE